MFPPKRSFKRSATNAGTSTFGLAPNGRAAAAPVSAGSCQNPIVIDDIETSSQEDMNDVILNAAPVRIMTVQSKAPFPARPMKRARTMPALDFSKPSKWQNVPVELKLQILDNLSLRDALAFTMAMPELRAQLRDPKWSTWRKRWHSIEVAEAAFDRYLFEKNQEAKRNQKRAAAGLSSNGATQTQGGIGTASQANSKNTQTPVSAQEARLCKIYKEVAAALDYEDVTDHGLAQLVNVLVKCGSIGPLSSVPKTYLLAFGRALMLGPSHSPKFENAPSCAFDHLPHAAATELISLTGTFLAIFRISCLFGNDRCGSNLRLARFIEADCTRALEHFFRLRIYLSPPGSASRLTSEQRVFVESTIKPGQVFKIQAFAGTGKTTSLVEFAKANPHRKMLYLAFNKAAQFDASKKFGSNVVCKTFHSLAFQYKPALSEPGNLRATELVEDHFRDTLPKGKTKETEKDLLPTTVAAYIMATLNSFMSSADLEVMTDHVPWKMKDATTLHPSDIVKATKQLWQWIQVGKDSRKKTVLCPHDAYVKILQLRGPVQPDPIVISDILLVDEAQDMSHCQIEILKRTFHQWGGVVIVGDKNQKIYDFRGASDKLFDDTYIPSDRNFLLTQSFRFGDNVAEVATSILRMKPIPDSAKNRTKPRLSGLKALNDAVYWSSSNLGATMTNSESENKPLVPPSLIWRADEPGKLAIAEEVAGLDVADYPSDNVDEPMQVEQNTGNDSDTTVEESDMDDFGSNGDPSASGSASKPRTKRATSPMPMNCARHTRIYRSNARLLLDAMILAMKYSQTKTKQNLFLKTAATLSKGALISLLTDAHRLYTGKKAQSRSLREYKSWIDLKQRVEAEGAAAANTQAGLVASLGTQLARPDWLDTVASLEEQFAPKEENATIVLSTVHQAKGLEWDRVVLSDDFRPDLMSDFVRAPYFPQSYFQSEINLIYVAVSRAQTELYLSDMLVQWLAYMEGYSRIEIDPRKNETDCSACGKRSATFLRRRVRLPRQDPLIALPGQVAEPYIYPTRCTACTTSDWPAFAYDDSVAANDYRDTVAVIEQITAGHDHEESVQDAADSSPADSADLSTAVDLVPESVLGTAKSTGRGTKFLDLSSAQRESIWDIRLLVEKNAILAEMGSCCARLSTSS